MHKLMEYVCDELEQLEKKADKDGKLSMAEIEYADKLTNLKKNLLKIDTMWDDSEYSMDDARVYDSRMYGRSYARNRGRRGGSYADGDTKMIVHDLKQLMDDSPDERTRMEFQKFIHKIEQM